MPKARRMMQEDIRLVDLIIELVDARVPLSSRNPDIDELGKHKARMILLNKADLADERLNKQWMDYFAGLGCSVVKINSRSGEGIKSINAVVQQACKEKIERDRRRGIKNRPIRAMVAGIPNVGKSTFINSYAGKSCTKTGNRPGVTKGKQWIRMNRAIELLDTPGILWPKFEDQAVGIKLAMIGSINEEILNVEELSLLTIDFLRRYYSGVLTEKFEVDETPEKPVEILTAIADRRKCIVRGGGPDYARAAALVMESFRNGKLGRFTLEDPEGTVRIS